ncbi:MAG TPA: trehalose-phosphatase [Thermodesulfobacteriota bacterium]|nr:trehalose-phosphatase [Thermodesulfobacteriota bacterium]
MVKHLFEDWESIQAMIQQAQNLFLFLDYDGTLTPIVSRPELALCPYEVKGHLEKLRDLPGVSLAIISGRSIGDVREKVGVSGITYVGNHGLEIENPAGRHKKILASARKREFKQITQNLQNSLKTIPGILFEDKGPILSVHYRNVPQKFFPQVLQIVEAELQQWRKRWKMASGKKVLEIRPNMNFNKGKAVKEILKTFPSQQLLPIYLGDDQTDEDAFRVLKSQGISVFVGMGKLSSEADFFLKSPDEVREFLFRCQEARRAGSSYCPGAT